MAKGDGRGQVASTAGLRQQVAAATGQQPGAAVPPQLTRAQEREQAANNAVARLGAMLPEFRKAAPTGVDVEQLVRDAQMAVRTDADLAACTLSSVLGATMNACQLGLRIGVMGQSWLSVQWRRNKGGDSQDDYTAYAKLTVGYQGWVTLAYRSGRVVSMSSEVVYQSEREQFRWWRDERGPHLLHEPDLDLASRYKERDLFAWYATCRTKGGGYEVTRPWGVPWMLEHRDRFGTNGRGEISAAWRQFLPQMGMKTMALRLITLMPKSEDMMHALAASDNVREDLEPTSKPAELHEVSGEATALMEEDE